MLGLNMSPTLVIFILGFSISHASWWHLHPHMAWNDVTIEHHINTSVHGDMFVVDLFDVPKRVIDDLHRNGKKVICYFSAGTKEDWRKDADQFPSDGLGVPNKHSPGETWVDITNIQVKRIMRNRTAIAKSRHCDGVVPTNVDGASGNQAGFYFTADNQLDYNRYLVTEAHGNDLAIGLMNDVLQLHELVGDFDFAINVSCMDYHECHEYKSFFYARKPVFHIQYVSSITEGYQMQREICSSLERPRYMNTIIKHKMVNWKLDC